MLCQRGNLIYSMFIERGLSAADCSEAPQKRDILVGKQLSVFVINRTLTLGSPGAVSAGTKSTEMQLLVHAKSLWVTLLISSFVF